MFETNSCLGGLMMALNNLGTVVCLTGVSSSVCPGTFGYRVKSIIYILVYFCCNQVTRPVVFVYGTEMRSNWLF